MKPEYKNWMPKGMVLGTAAGAAGCFGLAAVCGCTGLIKNKGVKTAATGAFLFAGAAAGGAALWMELLCQAFSYDGKRQMSRQIIEGIAEYVVLPEDGSKTKEPPIRILTDRRFFVDGYISGISAREHGSHRRFPHSGRARSCRRRPARSPG